MTIDTSESCTAKEPFIRLGTGEAPVLDYNLPQKTAFSVYGQFPVPIPRSYFKGTSFSVPVGHWWDRFKGVESGAISSSMKNIIASGIDPTGLIASKGSLRRTFDAEGQKTNTARKTEKMQTVRPDPLAMVDQNALAAAVQEGLKPVVSSTFGGTPIICFTPMPVKTNPKITIIEEYEVASYLGDYGAGSTVRTLSLLPGESTTITVRSYEERTESKTAAENILDSFTEESANEFETLLQDEQGTDSTASETMNRSTSGGLSLGIDLFGIVEFGAGGDGGLETDMTTSRSSYAKSISNTMSRHVNSASSHREVNVNTTSSESTTSGEEETITRQLRNINLSRVLNFVFRQLQQEYVTVTYLKNLRFVYTNGFPESEETVDISGLKDLLQRKVRASYVDEVYAQILKNYCKVYNYRDERKSFIEERVEEFGDCPWAEDGETVSYVRKRKDLSDSYKSITVNGVILNVDSYILRTSSLVCDALLGQGEALDCYNIHLQNAAVVGADLKNRVTETGLQIVDGVEDPVARAEAYATVFYPSGGDQASETDEA